MPKARSGFTGKVGFILIMVTLLLGFIMITVFAQNSPNGINPAKALTVSFIDVGQADCILVRTPTNQNMLIDAGNNEDFFTIRDFLQSRKILQLDEIVATHPHEDHIGSMGRIIRNFTVGKVYMPKVAANTKTFEELLMAVKAKGLKVSVVKAGVYFQLVPGITVEFLAPGGDSYENLNDYSAVTKLTYHNVSFLFAGDAGEASEREMIDSNQDLKADILKVGHHGSNSSSSTAFLQRIAPAVAVISVGAQNKYHHPGTAAIKRLTKSGARIYRTDRDGTVDIITDGNNIIVKCSRKNN